MGGRLHIREGMKKRRGATEIMGEQPSGEGALQRPGRTRLHTAREGGVAGARYEGAAAQRNNRADNH